MTILRQSIEKHSVMDNWPPHAPTRKLIPSCLQYLYFDGSVLTNYTTPLPYHISWWQERRSTQRPYHFNVQYNLKHRLQVLATVKAFVCVWFQKADSLIPPYKGPQTMRTKWRGGQNCLKIKIDGILNENETEKSHPYTYAGILRDLVSWNTFGKMKSLTGGTVSVLSL